MSSRAKMADTVGGAAPKVNGHANGAPSSYAAKYNLASHFIGGNELSKAAPSKVSVELAMEFAVKSGTLTALIVDGESKGSLTVTLEWEHGAETKG